MIELLLPCGFDTLEYSWVKATIGICTLADYSVVNKRQQSLKIMAKLSSTHYQYITNILHFRIIPLGPR
jgi:hypothetical protein